MGLMGAGLVPGSGSSGGGGGSVTSVSNIDGTVTVSPTTGAVVVSLPNVGPGAGSANYPSSITIDAEGRITAFGASTTPILVGGTAGGALTGTYPNPTLNPAVPLPNGIGATTQTAGDSTTKVATDAFVQSAVGLGNAYYSSITYN